MRLGRKESLSLRVFLDRSVVEVFANGKQCAAVRLYPGRDDSVGVSLRARGRDATLKSLDAWQMKSIHEPLGAAPKAAVAAFQGDADATLIAE